ncbi:hypothetical protein VP01_3g2 [Puccinia sorghi]|uniref:Uncharacterized protein n=1 Tax=Puccinia sorghi TaxID=27349 RepID=A0A0L6URZ9_9BASI|nr:hypothetical protein VP01_3g2 [Puccinia sorghi]
MWTEQKYMRVAAGLAHHLLNYAWKNLDCSLGNVATDHLRLCRRDLKISSSSVSPVIRVSGSGLSRNNFFYKGLLTAKFTFPQGILMNSQGILIIFSFSVFFFFQFEIYIFFFAQFIFLVFEDSPRPCGCCKLNHTSVYISEVASECICCTLLLDFSSFFLYSFLKSFFFSSSVINLQIFIVGMILSSMIVMKYHSIVAYEPFLYLVYLSSIDTSKLHIGSLIHFPLSLSKKGPKPFFPLYLAPLSESSSHSFNKLFLSHCIAIGNVELLNRQQIIKPFMIVEVNWKHSGGFGEEAAFLSIPFHTGPLHEIFTAHIKVLAASEQYVRCLTSSLMSPVIRCLLIGPGGSNGIFSHPQWNKIE